jgi:hypothetical protein
MSGQEDAALRKRPVAKATGTSDAPSSNPDPLDEEEQDLVIKQFQLEIDSQFCLLRGVMVALCAVWVGLLLWVLCQPLQVCQISNRGSMMIQDRPFQCPPNAVWTVRATAGLLVLGHGLSFAHLVMGSVALLRAGFAVLALPVGVLAYAFSAFVPPPSQPSAGASKLAPPPPSAAMRESILQSGRSGGPAVGDYLPNSNVDFRVLVGLLAAAVALSALFHFLSGHVYSSRDDLRRRLRELEAKKYQFKSL